MQYCRYTGVIFNNFVAAILYIKDILVEIMEKYKRIESIDKNPELNYLYTWADCFAESCIEGKIWGKKVFFSLNEFLLQFLPKETKVLTTSFLKEILEIEQTRLVILSAHLHIENFLDELLASNLKRPNKIVNSPFKWKLYVLYSLGVFDDETYQEINFINHARNQLAHNLRFDLLDLKIQKSPLMGRLNRANKYKSKWRQRKFLEQLIRLYFILILFNLTYQFPELHLLDY